MSSLVKPRSASGLRQSPLISVSRGVSLDSDALAPVLEGVALERLRLRPPRRPRRLGDPDLGGVSADEVVESVLGSDELLGSASLLGVAGVGVAGEPSGNLSSVIRNSFTDITGHVCGWCSPIGF